MPDGENWEKHSETYLQVFASEISAMLRDLTTLGGGTRWFNEISLKLRKLLSQGAGSSGGV